MSETELQTPIGVLSLKRFPIRAADRLRAWDAADELLINHLYQQPNLFGGKIRVLVFEDQFGAITCYLRKAAIEQGGSVSIDVMTDSLVSQHAIRQNLADNGVDDTHCTIQFVDNTLTPTKAYDLVVYKLPRNHGYFSDVMQRLRDCMTQSTNIVGGAMVKYLPKTVLSSLENTVGPTTTSLAAKKARLIFSDFNSSLKPANPYPTTYNIEEIGVELSNHSNVFSRDSLDIGTRLLLAVMPESDDPLTIVDLACGNGVIGVSAAQLNPNADLIFCDESNMAVASARVNVERCLPMRKTEFYHTDCLAGVAPNSVDLVLCNPPFHQQNAVSEHVGWQMFKESLQCLKSGGELWIVGNRHLGYHIKLKKLFGNATLVDSSNKFVVIKSVKR
ncbi:methyltransferase [Alkalimarinus sediminis]|uniref:Ribosomal RNA large subunit methyltransferase G n=1 Tax=Alkalimarinus sediminis TaxID=1632866 RepID=A0A9E8KRT5_9ALTE|nr:methyltransferase [Alkalimarinus sediminis]UZW76537.1 methyltransferase [Alkalimarinus sediminis]